MHTVYKERYVGLCSQVSSYWNSSVAFYKCVFLFPWGTLRAVCCKSSVYPTRVFNNYDSLSTWYVSDTLTTATTLWDRNSHVYWVKENTEASSSSPLNVDKWSEFLGQTQVPWLDIHGGGLTLWFFFQAIHRWVTLGRRGCWAGHSSPLRRNTVQCGTRNAQPCLQPHNRVRLHLKPVKLSW